VEQFSVLSLQFSVNSRCTFIDVILLEVDVRPMDDNGKPIVETKN
jgi:hypothetical protein